MISNKNSDDFEHLEDSSTDTAAPDTSDNDQARDEVLKRMLETPPNPNIGKKDKAE